MSPQEEPKRYRLPDNRLSITHSVEIGGKKFYFTVGMYSDGKIGEVFVTTEKEGSTLRAVLDAWATSFSVGLQYGIPLKRLTAKISHTSFEPSGFTTNKSIPMTKSVLDYFSTWILGEFPDGKYKNYEKLSFGK